MTVDRERVARDFHKAVNMSADEIEAWLLTPDSKRVGQKRGSEESIGHASGRRIVQILRKAEPSSGDSLHMRKVVGFVRRLCAQEPANIVTSRWRYSLMNWGHDALKEDG